MSFSPVIRICRHKKRRPSPRENNPEGMGAVARSRTAVGPLVPPRNNATGSEFRSTLAIGVPYHANLPTVKNTINFVCRPLTSWRDAPINLRAVNACHSMVQLMSRQQVFSHRRARLDSTTRDIAANRTARILDGQHRPPPVALPARGGEQDLQPEAVTASGVP